MGCLFPLTIFFIFLKVYKVKRFITLFLFLLVIAYGANQLQAQIEILPPAPVTEVTVMDKPNDNGESIIVRWKKSLDDGAGSFSVKEYEILRSVEKDGVYNLITTSPAGSEEYIDGNTIDGKDYYYIVRTTDGVNFIDSEPTEAVRSSAQWFHRGRINMLVAAVLLSTFVLWFIRRAQRGEELYIRPIAGLKAVDEAVGRATEMGKPILFIPGIMDMDNIQTIAGIIILGRVARKAAEYEASLLVPTARSIVMTTARETVKEAFTDAGRPDLFDPDKIRYLTDAQFGYAAGVDGIMIRERPAAVFFMGAFYAESLILAETGHSVGAIQIAGTAMPAQLPFFVTACDYTLIGEEFFAASAYLSKESRLLGSLKGQDLGKAIFIGILILGCVLATLGIGWLTTLLTVGQ